tara:strand:- start:44 stop:937 length:894 start_codon:yes stop_codon:yes gene_type:complete
MNSVQLFRGEVTSFNWSNPHTHIIIRLNDKQEEWFIETDAIPILRRAGWSSESLSVGEHIILRANPAYQGQSALLVSVQKQDNSLLTPRAHFDKSTALPIIREPAESLAGIWELEFGDLGDFMERWALTPITDKGRAAREQFLPEDRPAGKCIGTPTPQLMAMPFLNEIQIKENMVVIRSEFLNTERVIYTDGRMHPPDGQRTNQGHSIGYWDDGDLIVDTILFEDHRAPIRGPNEGVPSGNLRHVTERYSLNEDKTGINIDFSVVDPEYLVIPFSGSLSWKHVTTFSLADFKCETD